jgi:signal transduction histidine kinase
MAVQTLANLMPILTVQVREEMDVVAARQRARQLAAVIGFSSQDQVRIATAVSEIARNAFQFGGGRVEFAFNPSARPQSLSVSVIDGGPGIANLDAVLSGKHRSATGMGVGLMGSRRLMDTFEIDTKPGKGTTVHFSKFLPPDAPRLEMPGFLAMVGKLAQERPRPAQEAHIQNRDLLETLESLRQRDVELQRRQEELLQINAELEETNRGVVALYSELDEKAAALLSADELKGRFLRHVSHEFRTPLNSILALSDLLLRRIDGELTLEQERQVGYIRKAARDLTEIVNDLLDLAKVESGKTEVHLARIHLGQLLSSLRGLMRPLVTTENVSLIFEEPPAHFHFDADESKISQILRNLISNALKFTEQGEVRVATEIGPGFLKVSVTDTGIGIAPEDQEHIFQEFAQVANPIQKRVKGTGLGLPLSRKLAALLGGELTVRSRPGAGATFTLTLPVSEQQSAAADDQSESILIIDDEETSRYLVRQRFRGTRHRLLEASSGAEGTERARFEQPALILLDLVIPDRSGFDVLDDLKRDPATSGIPVMIHTSRRLGCADIERLGGRQAGVLPKAEAWPGDAMDYIRTLLGEANLFAGENSQ